MADLNVVMKNSRLCNLRCTYCTDWREGSGQTMSFEVMARAIAFCLRDPRYERITFNWHGGEPMLLPTAFYERVLQGCRPASAAPINSSATRCRATGQD